MRKVINYLINHKLLLIPALLYVGLSLSFIVGNGLYRCETGCGLYIGQWHLHDSMWHLALAKLGFGSFPLVHPEYSGASLSGYNYLLDFVIFILSNLGLSPLFVFFRLLPVVFSILFVYFVYDYALEKSRDPLYVFSFSCFMFFGSSFTYLITWFYNNSLYYSSMKGFPVVTSVQPSLIFLNLQFAYSLLSFFLIFKLLKSTSLKKYFFIPLLIVLTFGLKFYGGVVLVLFVVLLSLNNLKLLAATVVAVLLSYILFYNGGTESFPFSFAPFALTHLMFDDPLLFYNHKITLARYYLYEQGISLRLVVIEAGAVILFALINFGTRLFALPMLFSKKTRSTWTKNEFTMLSIIILTFLVPVFFVQDGGWYNTMQFLYYGVFFAGFFAADYLYNMLSQKTLKSIIFGLTIIVLSLPNAVDQLRYISAKQNLISDDELAGLNFLSTQKTGSIFVTNSQKKTAYISALSGQPTYFTDLDQLMVTNVDYQERLSQLDNLGSRDLKSIYANYWYLHKSDEDYQVLRPRLDTMPQFTNIYENNTVLIYHNQI